MGCSSCGNSCKGERGKDRCECCIGGHAPLSISMEESEMGSVTPGAALERVDVRRVRTGPTPEEEWEWCRGGSSGSKDRSATSQTSTRSGARSTCEIHGRESKTEEPKAAAMSGRACRRREQRELVLWVRRRFAELHDDDALDICHKWASMMQSATRRGGERTLDLCTLGTEMFTGDKSLGGLKRPVD